jgi:hypothetical protein
MKREKLSSTQQRQADAEEKFLEKQRRRVKYGKYLSIIIVLTVLFGALTLLQAPVPTVIPAL